MGAHHQLMPSTPDDTPVHAPAGLQVSAAKDAKSSRTATAMGQSTERNACDGRPHECGGEMPVIGEINAQMHATYVIVNGPVLIPAEKSPMNETILNQKISKFVNGAWWSAVLFARALASVAFEPYRPQHNQIVVMASVCARAMRPARHTLVGVFLTSSEK